jgi:hypothetical protein
MGTGKTAIVRTIADRLERDGMLGCAYFVSRNESSTDPRNMIRTMAYELAKTFEGLRSIICEGIAALGDIYSAPLLKMIHALIVAPLTFRLEQDVRPVVFIFDGLHHAFRINGPSMKTFLPALVSALPWGTKLLFASVDDRTTATLIRCLPRTPLATTLHLQNPNAVLADVTTFYFQRFASIIGSHPSSEDQMWITDAVGSLAIATGHLFLFASTIARYVSAAVHDPYKRLREVVVAVRKASGDSSVVFEPLDTIYRLILEDACIDGMNERNPEVQDRLRFMLAYIIVAGGQLTMRDLAKLLTIDQALVRDYVDVLSSILDVIQEDPQPYVRLFHPSLGEFLLDPLRCKKDWAIPVHDTHLSLARFCFDVMESTLTTVNWMAASTAGAGETIQLQQSLRAKSGLIYACTRWTLHVASMESFSKEFLDRLARFCTSLILPWLEVVCGLDQVEATCMGLKAMTTSISVRRAWVSLKHDLTASSLDQNARVSALGAHRLVTARCTHASRSFWLCAQESPGAHLPHWSSLHAQLRSFRNLPKSTSRSSHRCWLISVSAICSCHSGPRGQSLVSRSVA